MVLYRTASDTDADTTKWIHTKADAHGATRCMQLRGTMIIIYVKYIKTTKHAQYVSAVSGHGHITATREGD